MDAVNEIWENQRWYGIGWCAASALLLSQVAGIAHAYQAEAGTAPFAGPLPSRTNPARSHTVAEQHPYASRILCPTGSLRAC